ncbi:hypothetical protein [Polaromonas sp. SM01]|uniref:helix-turn-helix transcriptional regulator n=1 Tax=Polaromonas sp. SM01 TaxID=3085630 RepID=UPI0029827572|nr:hypothetical protein [Polaromonas sp. SM01]MDW5443798.1 hypothetical protein [Polaromonas sp. SM01]
MPVSPNTCSCHPELPKLMFKSDVANLMNVCTKTIENRVKEGKFPAPKYLGREPIWHPKTIHTWLESFFLTDESTEENKNSMGTNFGSCITKPSKKTTPVPAVERMNARNTKKFLALSNA